MVIIGTLALALALGASLASAVTGFVAGRTGSARLSEVSRHALYSSLGFIGIASAALLYAFLSYDFSISYVQARADTRMPMYYLVSAFWGGADGSLLYWVLITSTLGSLAVREAVDRIPEVIPWVQGVLSSVVAGLIVIILFKSNPFETFFVIDTPIEGEGLNPLLQTPLMVIHPQALLSGFAAMAVPYSFGMGALLAKDISADWLKATRKWMLIAWLLLSIGNILGGMWAYRELGWGGYWAWDKVENFALIPWFAASAYLHSAIIQEQRGMLKRWNVVLVSLTFILTIFGTYMTRSGFIESVHSFAESEVGPYFLTYLVTITVLTVGLIAKHWRELEGETQLESTVSREGAFVANNWLLVGMAFVVLWGSVFPDIKGAFTGETVAIGPPWFNKIMSPLAVLLMLMIALGTLLPWRRVTMKALRRNFTIPVTVMVIGTPLVLVTYWQLRGRHLGVEPLGWSRGLAIVGLAMVILNLTTLVIEFQRGISARLKARDRGIIDATMNLFSRHRRRYGGYTVHVGVILIFMAFLGNAIKAEVGPTLRVGDRVPIADYEVVFADFNSVEERDHRAHIARMDLYRDGRLVDQLTPARFDYNNYANLRGQQPDPMNVTSEIYVSSGPLEDIYIALLSFSEEDGEISAAFQIEVFPFTWWFWFGGVMLVFGTMIALWPEEDTTRTVGTRTGTAALLLVGLLAASAVAPAEAYAQDESEETDELPEHRPPPNAPPLEELVSGPLSAEAREIAEDAFGLVMTTCRGCTGTLSTASPSCYPSNVDRRRIEAMAQAGMELDAILNVFEEERGPQAVAIPTDTSTRRASWIIPTVALVSIAGALVLWLRRRAAGDDAGPAEVDEVVDDEDDAYLAQLRDELRRS